MEATHTIEDARRGDLEGLLTVSNLTQRQLLIWISQRLRPNAPDHNVAGLFMVDGRLDDAAFAQAVRDLVMTFDCLRTVIVERDGVPRQEVRASMAPEVECIDLRAEAEPMQCLEHVLRARVRTPFALDRPLFGFTVVHIDAHRSAWLMCLHHVICDGASMRLLFDRLSILYAHARQPSPSPLPAAAPSFRTFVDAHLAHRATPAFARDRAWWDERLRAEAPPLLYGRPVPSGNGSARRIRRDLGAVRSDRMRAAAAAHAPFLGAHAALQNVLATALLAWLHRVGPSDSPTVALGFHNRTPPFLETAGLLMQTLPVRVCITQEDTFHTLLEKTAHAGLEATAHGGFAVANALHRRAWEVVLNYLPTHFPAFAEMPVCHEWVYTEHADAALTVTVHDFDRSGALRLDFDVRLEAFPEPIASRVTDHVLTLLDAMLDAPGAPVGTLALLPEAERQRLLEGQARAAPRLSDTFVSMFARAAHRRADAVAMRTVESAWTYADLDRASTQLADRLVSSGIMHGDVVAIQLRTTQLIPVAVLGVLKLGAIYLPIEPSYPRERRDFMLDDAGARAIVTERALCDETTDTRIVLTLDPPAAPSEALPIPVDTSRVCRPERPGLDDVAYIIYTSGSTGRPKGVRILHRSLAAFLQALSTMWIDETDAVYFTSPLSFDMHVGDLLLPLALGATVLPIARDVAGDGRRLRQAFETLGGSASFATPATFRMLIDAGWEGSPALKVLCGGEAMSPELARELAKRVGTLRNVYGPTETTCFVLEHEVSPNDAPVPIGRPIAGVRLYIVDRHGQLVPEGMPGELLIGGPQVGADYLAQPELSADRFRPDPFVHVPGARVYRSGDQVCLRPDGEVLYLGRLDDQVKIRGYRIELGEIERALERHPDVRQAVVTVREDRSGDRRLVAYVRTTAENGVLDAHLRRALPSFMVPSAIVAVAHLPLSSNGKIDRAALPAPAQDRACLTDSDTPRTLLEFQIAKSFEEVLGVRPVGIHDDFFALGGSSLLAVQLLRAIEAALDQTTLSLQQLYEAPTPHGLSTRLEEGGRSPAVRPLVLLQPKGEASPFFCVHAFIGDVCRDLARHCGTDHPFYGFQPRGLDGREAPLATLSEMAAFYIEQMQRVQPHGPYLLGGYSFGGLVAHEMARQLQQRGESVGLLVVIDTSPWHARPRTFLGKVNRLLNLPLVAIERALSTLARGSLRTLPARVHRWVHGRRLGRRAGATDPATLEADLDRVPLGAHMAGLAQWPDTYQRIARTHMLAFLRHIPEPYNGTVTLIRRRARHHRFAREAADWGWSDVATTVDVHYVDGHHDEIMVEPGVAAVGQIVAERLRCHAPPAAHPR